MILIDTSAWVEYFRASGSAAAHEVRRLISDHADQLAMCEPVAMEILCGATDDNAQAKLERLVNGLPSLPVDNAIDFRAAAEVYRSARRVGATIRSITDCLIAAVAIRHGATVMHRDADFDVIARITRLDAQSLR
ncbi:MULTISPECIES: type II toxin-antitoxin system VapC family toxin [Mycobacterium]|uniref:Ribonuclease VapC n=1 Tax=Mycobacterium kiyosense TaxID=2871094 RepID=A0A9P3Q3T6_9MYCO|nr:MULTISPECIES: PIN domain nuclease [Mycobacterium]BDB42939.1 VapC ribonuclease [Mycobacterium kiyosense]BDE13833.1 VapC ribonuclease [Mycobacterium sp. 20KCMC460]GLB84187.1 VapC ribonuclease [Mycobacterium kiyosense]GLB90831.1 VapC ribonuclease [Mycobacterium kiyosense]GLB94471.1 VapC ribonuclease [Mycobacterium kiyosense]